MQLAPIILFVYSRPQHTLKTLNALKNNYLANKSMLYIYCDGVKPNADEKTRASINEVRTLVKTEKWCKEVIIVERDKNFGLAKNVIDGISTVLNKHGKIIVLEDDMITSKQFLEYMNFSLNYYENNEQVFHINGHNYQSKFQFILDNYYFTRYMNCWGWATWKNRWDKLNTDYSFFYNKLIENKKLLKDFNYDNSLDFHNQLLFNIQGKMNTWAILWYATIFFNNGLCLTSKRTYVKNIGLDGTGENCFETNLQNEIQENINGFKGNLKVKEKRKSRLHFITYYELKKPFGVLKFIYRKIKNVFS